MSYNREEIKNLALLNKRKLRNKFFKVPSDGEEYKFKISGIGASFIKIEKFFYYKDIAKKVSDGNTHCLEYSIGKIISDPFKKKKSILKSEEQLRESALANKSTLKRQYIDAFIGENDYEFKISGIGNKSVKVELYIGYDEIADELSMGNDVTLEFILYELLLGNEVNYSKFNREDTERLTKNDRKVKKTPNEEIIEEIDIDDIKKLSDDEFEEIIVNVKGWQKLVFDSIDDILDDTFTLDLLLKQNRILSYQSSGENLEDKVLDNLNPLIKLGLVAKINKTTYVKLW